MTTRFAAALTVTAMCLIPLAWAGPTELPDPPLVNWTVPPYWAPPVPNLAEGGAGGRMVAQAQELAVQAQALPSSPLPFTAITPCRVADTRGYGFTGEYGPPALVSGSDRSFTIPGQCGIPSGAVAVSFNFTILEMTTGGDLRVYPAGDTAPLVSTQNWTVSTGAIANAAIVPLGSGGAVTVRLDGLGSAELIIDVNGYFAPQSVVTSLTGGASTLTGDVTLAEGANITITPSGNTLTIAAAGGGGSVLPIGSPGQTLYSDGSSWLASGFLSNTGSAIGIGTSTPEYQLDLNGMMNMPATVATSGTPTAGVLLLGGRPFLHAYAPPGSSGGNTFVGQGAGNFTMGGGDSNDGASNTAIGEGSLSSNTTGHSNTASGSMTLAANTTGTANTATGSASLGSNTAGSGNTASGYQALYDLNIADGTGANTAVGYNSGRGIVTGVNNTIIGANVTGLASTLSNHIIIADGAGNQRIVADGSGNVGIGTSTPGYPLDVNGTAKATDLVLTNPAPVASGGTGTNLSATGPGYLKQAAAGANVTVGTIAGADLPAMSTDAKGAVPPTGTPAGNFLRDDGEWAAAGGGGPGGVSGALQYNNGGAFGGILGSSVSGSAASLLGAFTADSLTLSAAASGNGMTVFSMPSSYADRGPFNWTYNQNHGSTDPVWFFGYNFGSSHPRDNPQDGAIGLSFEGDWNGAGEFHITSVDLADVYHRMLSFAMTYATGATSVSLAASQFVIYDVGPATPTPLMSFAASYGSNPESAQVSLDHGAFYVATYGSGLMFRNHDQSGYIPGLAFDPYSTHGYDNLVIGWPALNATETKAEINGELKLYNVTAAHVPATIYGASSQSGDYLQARTVGNALVFGVSATGQVTGSGFTAGTSAGLTTVVTVRDAGGTADCTMTYTGGLLTATTCSHT
jgi:hypothetical protein